MTPDPTDIDRLIDTALVEDLGKNGEAWNVVGDITGHAVIPEDAELEAALTTREDVVVAGLDVALAVFRRLDPEAVLEPRVHDGDHAASATVLARIKGDARALLAGERTALNFIQHLSGIATLTRAYVEKIKGRKLSCYKKNNDKKNILLFWHSFLCIKIYHKILNQHSKKYSSDKNSGII